MRYILITDKSVIYSLYHTIFQKRKQIQDIVPFLEGYTLYESGEVKMIKRRGIPIQKASNQEILRKQMEMLAEDSVGSRGMELVQKSRAVNELYKTLVQPFPMKLFLCALILIHLFSGFLIKINKLFRR